MPISQTEIVCVKFPNLPPAMNIQIQLKAGPPQFPIQMTKRSDREHHQTTRPA